MSILDKKIQFIKTANDNGITGVVTRQDIIDLMKNDPDRYMALSDEILTAYAEKRVK